MPENHIVAGSSHGVSQMPGQQPGLTPVIRTGPCHQVPMDVPVGQEIGPDDGNAGLIDGPVPFRAGPGILGIQKNQVWFLTDGGFHVPPESGVIPVGIEHLEKDPGPFRHLAEGLHIPVEIVKSAAGLKIDDTPARGAASG